MTSSRQEQALIELYEIVRLLTSINAENAGDVLQRIVEIARRVLEADLISLYKLDKNSQTFSRSLSGKIIGDESETKKTSESVVLRILEKYYKEKNSQKDDSFFVREKIISSAAVPLTIGDNVIGVLFVNYRTPQSFTDEQRRLIELFANQAAIAIKYVQMIAEQKVDISKLKYFSCFVSHSSKDEKFVQKLYEDLSEHDVTCWYAPVDLKIGEKIRSKINDVVTEYDKLLIVLSKSSIGSQWVEQEVEKALEKERKSNSIMLFPIRLDDEVMKAESGWANYVRNTRNIGDFTNWTQENFYQESLNRLLRDLEKKF
jgi:hypothetical protein